MSLFAKIKRQEDAATPPLKRGDAEKKPPQRSAAGWDAERERSRQASAAKSRSGRDIARGMPQVVDPKRKADCAESFEAFCLTYFPEVFRLEWSADHLKAIDRIETAAREGGLFAYAMPRGSGKTSLAESAILWTVLNGYRKYPVVIGPTGPKALQLLESVKSEIENNDLLLDDYPEVCYPIRCLEGVTQRGNAQLFDGRRTHIGWSATDIVLPTIPGSKAAAAVIEVKGITGDIRGKKYKRPDGKSVRPDFVIVDDPQTDESAKSPQQCEDRLRTLCGAVLGLAGPGEKIAGVMPCTVIYPGDMADQVLDRQKHPEWQGERTKLVYRFPGEADPDQAGKESPDETARRERTSGLWEQYKRVRADGLRAGDNGAAGTDFYRANRAAMDHGAKVAWPARFNRDEISAIQHAMNLRFDLGDAAFFAEFQNEPIKGEGERLDALTADQIAGKFNGRPRGEVPNEVTRIVAHVDVQKALLYWVVCGFEDDFTGYVLSYGVFPRQSRSYFSLRDVKKTAQSVLGTASLEETIYAGLTECVGDLLGQKWVREDGKEMSIERCPIDANWGESTDVVYQWCRETPHSAIVVPSHGVGVGAKNRPFNEYRKKKGDEIGDHWRRPAGSGKRSVRYVVFDSNHWKSFAHERFRVPMGGRGCLSVFGNNAIDHKLFADHLTAEEPVPVTAKGRTVTEWLWKNTRPDNHWLDNVVGCCVAASMQKISLAERKQEAKRPARRIKLSELQAAKAAGR